VPVEPSNLPLNLAAAEQSQLLQTMAQMQGRALDQAAAVESQDRAKREAADQVQAARETELGTVQAGAGGAGTSPPPGGEEKKERPEDRPAPAEAENPPDPAGRGQRIDIRL